MAVIALIFKIIGITLLAVILILILLLHFSVCVYLHAGADGVRYSVKYLGFTVYPRKKKPEKADADTPEKPDDPDEVAELADVEEDDLEAEVERFASEYQTAEYDEDTADEQIAEQIEDETDGSESLPEDTAALEDTDKKDKTAEKESTDKSEKSDSKKRSGGLAAKVKSIRRKYEKIRPYIPYTWKMFKKLLKTVRIRLDDVSMTVGREDAHEAAIYYGSLQVIVSHMLMALGGMFSLSVKKCDISCRFSENHFSGSGDISVRIRPSAAVFIVLCIAVNAAVIFIKQKLKARKAKKVLTADV